MSNETEEITCPICKDKMLVPRIYSCGHTICEPCMIQTDLVNEENNDRIFTTTIYKCPLCRDETYLGLEHRPINRALLEQLRQNPDYEESYNQYIANKENNSEEYSQDIDLGELALERRNNKTNIIYKEILPILYKAAKNGQPFVTITHNNKNIQLVADLLASKFFHKNKIYKLISTPRECTIEIIPSKKSYKNEFINPQYANSRDSEIPEPPPPPPRGHPHLSAPSRVINTDIRTIFERLRDRDRY